MFILRSVALSDLDDLFSLSQHYTFINLPQDRDIIESKIRSSIKSFSKPSEKLEDNHYIFVLEDTERRSVIGCSMIHAQHGTEDEPHFFLKVGQENKFSKSINTGFIHGTLKLGYDTNGPSEIGGLILDPNYRQNPYKLGKQLSFVRFLYMGLYPQQFKETVHSELMPPFNKDGKSPLWEAIGRRFLNMEYQDADLLSRNNKEFILSLFPAGTIYETLLPIEARNAIGKVGKDTQPVKRMLEKIGFEYSEEVDPFDGGPHYRAKLKDLTPIKEIFEARIEFADKVSIDNKLLVHVPNKDYPFFAIFTEAIKEDGKVILPNKVRSFFKDDKDSKTHATII